MRHLVFLALVLLHGMALAKRILLIPLDSRPSSVDMSLMMAEVAGWEIFLPPEECLGKFLEAGNPEGIIAWLKEEDLRKGDMLVVSADMLAYGGLVASRVPTVASSTAIKRLSVLQNIKEKHPDVPIYVFSALMRSAPTATTRNRNWRNELTRYVELSDRYERTRDQTLLPALRTLKEKIPPDELERYFLARNRNMRVHHALIKMVKEKTIDYLIIGADDARANGPQYQELSDLKSTAEQLGIAGKIYFLDGIDQCGNLLISRAVLRSVNMTPHVWVEYSDPEHAKRRTTYEMHPLTIVVRDQILASGARLATSKNTADYTLFVHLPNVEKASFNAFLQHLRQALLEGEKIALADVSAERGKSDPQIVSEIFSPQNNFSRILAYVGWNTAGNTIGMSVSQANVYLNALEHNPSPVQRESAHVRFLFHRYIFDYAFNTIVRPIAFDVVSLEENGAKEHLSDEALERMQKFVQQTLERILQRAYAEIFSQVIIFAGPATYRIAKIDNISVSLPWRRVWEVKVRFDIVLELNKPALSRQERNEPSSPL